MYQDPDLYQLLDLYLVLMKVLNWASGMGDLSAEKLGLWLSYNLVQ